MHESIVLGIDVAGCLAGRAVGFSALLSMSNVTKII